MARVKNQKAEELDEVDVMFDLKREAKMAAKNIRNTARETAAANKRIRDARQREYEVTHEDDTDEYGDAIRLGYVWAALVAVTVAAILMHANGVFGS